MTLVVIDGPTIPGGESLSDGIDCTSGQIVRITVPQEYTPGNMTFQVSSDGGLYNDLHDSRGGEIIITAKPDTTIYIGEPWVRSVGFLKIRSGTSDHPVVQREDCKFAIAVETDSGGAAAASASRGGQAGRMPPRSGNPRDC